MSKMYEETCTFHHCDWDWVYYHGEISACRGHT